MYSATIDLVAECQKWLRNVAYVKYNHGLKYLEWIRILPQTASELNQISFCI